MSPASRTFWRRFFLLDRKLGWTAGELKRVPERRHISPRDPFFRWRRWFLRRGARDGLALVVGVCAIRAVFILMGVALWNTFVTPAFVAAPNGTRSISVTTYVLIVVQWLAVTTFAFWHIFRSARLERRALRSELRRRGIPICIACGYEGGDMSAPKCPECGAVQST